MIIVPSFLEARMHPSNHLLCIIINPVNLFLTSLLFNPQCAG